MNLWRLVRVFAGLALLSSSKWLGHLNLNANYFFPLCLSGAYLAFIEFFTLLVLWKRSSASRFVSRYKFWQFEWTRVTTRFELYKPHANEIYVGGSFNDWGRAPMERDPSRPGYWKLDRKLEIGEHQYLFYVDGDWEKDPNCSKFHPNPHGGVNCVKLVGTKSFPKARVSIRTTFIQILIAVSGFVLAFISAQTSLTFRKQAITSILISIIFGLLYSFIFSGGIVEERGKQDQEITIQGFHEDWMEICLNIQVTALIFGLALLIYT